MFQKLRRVLILLFLLFCAAVLLWLSRLEKVQRAVAGWIQDSQVALTKDQEAKKIRFVLRGTVSRVRTGDTFDLTTATGVNTVRLAGVRAPEMPWFDVPKHTVSPAALASQAFLTKTIFGSQVEAQVLAIKTNRALLAIVEQDGRNLNALVLESGLASLQPRDLPLLPLSVRLQMEKSARPEPAVPVHR
jgi:endonuclease YncB( thermonuclease family)